MFEIVQEGSEYFLLVLLELFGAWAFHGILSGILKVDVGLFDHFFKFLDLLEEFRVLLFDDSLNNFDLGFFFLRFVHSATK